MRSRWLCSMLIVIGCLSATGAYGLWSLQQTVFDPEVTEELVRAVLRSRPVQTALSEDLAVEVAGELPAGAADEDELQAVAADAVADPRFAATLVSSVASAHRRSLSEPGESAKTVTVAGRGLERAVRDALERENPRLARRLPPGAELALKFEMRQMPARGNLRDRVSGLIVVTALLALLLISLALLAALDRPDTLRRAGRLLAVTGAAWISLLLVGPSLLVHAGDRAATLAPVIDVFAGRLTPPAVVFTVLGAGIWGAGHLWRRARRQALADSGPTASTESSRLPGDLGEDDSEPSGRAPEAGSVPGVGPAGRLEEPADTAPDFVLAGSGANPQGPSWGPTRLHSGDDPGTR